MEDPKNIELVRLEHLHQEKIKSIELHNQYILIQHQTNCECFRDSIKYTVDISKIVLNGSLLLNGAGIIPIVYSKVDFLYPAAIQFAWGALCSVCAASFGYLYQTLVTETWRSASFTARESPSREAYEEAQAGSFLLKRMNVLFWIAVALAVLSLFQFGKGVYLTTEYLGQAQSSTTTQNHPTQSVPRTRNPILPASPASGTQ